MSRSALNANKKPWKKTDEQILLIKEGQITTTFGDRQIYKVRVARWGKFQGVLQKRLFRYDKQVLDYIPGRSMGFNLQDFQIIVEKKEQILKSLQQLKVAAQEDAKIKQKEHAIKKQKFQEKIKKELEKKKEQQDQNQKGI